MDLTLVKEKKFMKHKKNEKNEIISNESWHQESEINSYQSSTK